MSATRGSGWDLPAGAEPWSVFHWYRVSPRSSLCCVVLSQAPYWYLGHFLEGRMYPCEGVPCQMCGEGVGQQVRWVFAIAEVNTRRAGLIEVSTSIADILRSWSAECGGLRGMQVEFFKHSHSLRSRTEVRLIREDLPAWYLALEVPDPETALLCTWKKQGALRRRDSSSVSSSLSGSGARARKPSGLV
jgi:hypothetical protein